MIIKDGSILTLEPEIRLKLIFTIPLAFVIRLFTWAKESHVALILFGGVKEYIGKVGFNQVSLSTKLAIIPEHEKVYVREPIAPFNNDQIEKLRNLCAEEVGNKYGVGAASYTALNAIPLINKINFGRNKSACSIFVCKAMKEIGVLSEKVDPYNINPKELMRRIDKSGFYQKKQLVKK